MTKAEIAQKWAEANEAMQATQLTLDAAHTAHNDAVRVEAEAWEALQASSGRVATPPGVVPADEAILFTVNGGPHEPTRQTYRHSLAVKPIG